VTPAERLLEAISKLFFTVAGLALFLLAVALVAVAIRTVATALPGPEALPQILSSIGLLTIAVAVFEVAKFLFEEELIRERELCSITDVRLSLTKFFTIVIIVLSLEAIVLLFEVKLDHVDRLIYPTALMGVAILVLVGLGLFRWLTDPSPGTARERRIEEEIVRAGGPPGARDDAAEKP
jgi:hypothetical protein